MSRKNQSLILSEVQGQLSEELTYQSKLRTAVFEAVSEADVRAIVGGIVKRAKEGDPASVKHLFEYVMGASKPVNLTQNNHFEGAPPRRKRKALDGTPGSEERINQLKKRVARREPAFDGA